MKIENIEEFFNLCTSIFLRDRNKASFNLRVRVKNGDLVARITNKAVHYTYTTNQFDDLKRLNTLSGIIMRICSESDDKQLTEDDLTKIESLVREDMHNFHQEKEKKEKEQRERQSQKNKKKKQKKRGK